MKGQSLSVTTLAHHLQTGQRGNYPASTGKTESFIGNSAKFVDRIRRESVNEEDLMVSFDVVNQVVAVLYQVKKI